MSAYLAFYFMRRACTPTYNFNPKVLELNLPKFEESPIDANNPPDEVREAAADMGFDVELYKEMYLNRPTICEVTTAYYNACVKKHPENVSQCSSHLEDKEGLFRCSEFEEKYSARTFKYSAAQYKAL